MSTDSRREWHERAGLIFSGARTTDPGWTVTPVVLTKEILEGDIAVFADRMAAEDLRRRIGNPFTESE